MPIIYIMCGIPGSGKTTLSSHLAYEYGLTLYSYDELRNNRQFNHIRLKSYLFSLITQSLTNNENVIVDNLYITKESRYELLSIISSIPCKKILIVLQTPLDVCVDRDANRASHILGRRAICNFSNKYEQPTLDEGWDEILYY